MFQDLENIPRSPYELPDGKILELGSERYEACEILFNPGEFNISEDIVRPDEILYGFDNEMNASIF